MKKNILLFMLLMLLNNLAFSQSTSEGFIKYSVNYNSDNPQYKDMFKNSTMSIQFKNDNSRIEMNLGIIKNTTITIGNKTTILTDAMGQKYKMESTPDLEKSKKLNDDLYEIQYTNETKMIAGYECKKAIITLKKDNKSMEMWYTDKLFPMAYKNTQYSKFKAGCPMEYSMKEKDMDFTLTAIEVNTNPVSDDIFVIPDGYQEMDLNMLKMMNGNQTPPLKN